MTRKSSAISALIQNFQGKGLDAHYLGFLECFNRRLYYEAHDVLEELWLPQRTGPNGLFYKGLIQLAGAFVHLQKNRPQPAAALLKLARANLGKYPAMHEHLKVSDVLDLIQTWLERLDKSDFNVNSLTECAVPVLELAR